MKPYYFAYEDLIDDWQKIMKESNIIDKKSGKSVLQEQPIIEVSDFTDVMLLSNGISTDLLKEKKDTNSVTIKDNTKTDESILDSTAIVPPRREIG